MSKAHPEMEALAAIAHGALAALHGLSALYHWRADRPGHATIHALAAAYDVGSIVLHVRDAGNCASRVSEAVFEGPYSGPKTRSTD